jgi:phage baseplate assembly protein W
MPAKYTDINFNYGNDSREVVVTELTAIKYSLIRFLKTPIGSVPFNRTFGSSLHQLLFESSAGLDFTDIKVLLYNEIIEWEPRIELNPLDISVSQTDVHTYTLTCSFTVPSLSDQVSSLTTTITE